MPMRMEMDASEVTDAIDKLLENVHALPDDFATELTDWQAEDMRRKYPETDRPDENTAETDVYPRSRTWHKPPTGQPPGRPPTQHYRSSFLRVPRGARPKSPTGQRSGFRSGRPILRSELFESLSMRISELLRRAKLME
jgi:hypothetical protein